MEEMVLLRCRCGLLTDTLALYCCTDEADAWVSITQVVYPRTLRERLVAAWKVLTGQQEGYTAETLLEVEQVDRLMEYLAEFKRQCN